jgi:hypothetical protein
MKNTLTFEQVKNNVVIHYKEFVKLLEDNNTISEENEYGINLILEADDINDLVNVLDGLGWGDEAYDFILGSIID